jgi:hypothetical protein
MLLASFPVLPGATVPKQFQPSIIACLLLLLLLFFFYFFIYFKVTYSYNNSLSLLWMGEAVVF